MTMLEPALPWLRDVNRFLGAERAPSPFLPPADVAEASGSPELASDGSKS
jgi:hypothetical protein